MTYGGKPNDTTSEQGDHSLPARERMVSGHVHDGYTLYDGVCEGCDPTRCPETLQCHQEAGHDGPHKAIAIRDSEHEWRTSSGLSSDAMDWAPQPGAAVADRDS